MTLFCSKCGKQIPENAKYCPYCGEEVIFNRNNPDAVEIKLEDIKEAEFEEPKEEPKQEVKQEVVEDNSELIAQYEREIEECARKRKNLAIPGGIIFGIFTIATLVFSVLLSRLGGDYAEMIYNSEAFVNLPIEFYIYLAVGSFCSLLSDGGLALLLIGIIPNTIKITKRRNKIDELKGYRK